MERERDLVANPKNASLILTTASLHEAADEMERLVEEEKERQSSNANDRLFIGVMPAGISYCDKTVEEHGDYKKLAFLPYDTLKLELREDCPEDLARTIRKDAASIQAKAGELYPVSATGQTVLLGSSLPEIVEEEEGLSV